MRFHFHRWELVRHTGVHSYVRCKRCGERRINKVAHALQPVDSGWLKTGEWTPRPTFPPPKPSDAASSARPKDLGLAEGSRIAFAPSSVEQPSGPVIGGLRLAGTGVQPLRPRPDVPLDQTTAPIHYEGDAKHDPDCPCGACVADLAESV
jgi:hypothetical protein